MRIRVHSFWQDVKGRKVQAGDYERDELPLGVASYLVKNGHATVINELPDTPAGNALEAQNESTEALPKETTQESKVDSHRDVLIAEYEALTGNTAPWNISNATMEARIKEAKALD